MRISKDKVVSIEYRMLDADGALIGSSDDAEPISFIQGRGTVFSAIEELVEGHSLGERLVGTLQPEQTYGLRDEGLSRQAIPRSRFSDRAGLRSGMTFLSGRPGQRRLVTLVEVMQDDVIVDANHPLAGQTLKIELAIVEVRDALEEELATGSIQEMADIYAREQRKERLQGVPVQGPLLGRLG